jgi:hypothetical protein
MPNQKSFETLQQNVNPAGVMKINSSALGLH